MAHKSLIGGTVYEISDGKTLINGTAYSIKNGKTLLGGTAYEVGFRPVITITGRGYGDAMGNSNLGCYIDVDGNRYATPTELSLPVGTVIKCTAYGASSSYPSQIILNGATVKTSSGNTTYDYVVAKDATIGLDGGYNYMAGAYGTITITEH